LWARSSLFVLLAGCDFVFGLSGQPAPCDLASFEDAARTDITQAEEFSVDWDQTFALFTESGLNWQIALPDGAPVMIDLGLYMNSSLALAPEGNALFFTAQIEPQTLKGAVRGGDTWQLGAEVPRGTFAGTPSADVFGPRRVIVRERVASEDVQEFEDVDGHWEPIGEPLPLLSVGAPNLTPNGLTMVYAGFDDALEPVVFARSRDGVDEPFGEPFALRKGALRAPQLCGQCKQLYVIDSGVDAAGGDTTLIVRYDR
jgi:hypothetical protein